MEVYTAMTIPPCLARVLNEAGRLEESMGTDSLVVDDLEYIKEHSERILVAFRESPGGPVGAVANDIAISLTEIAARCLLILNNGTPKRCDPEPCSRHL